MKPGTFQHRTGILAAVWILSAGIIALLADINSIGMAIVVIVVAVVPPFVLLLRPQHPVRRHIYHLIRKGFSC